MRHQPTERTPAEIGETIRSLREARGISQADMARIAGVKSVTQWKYETGKTVPGAEKMARIAEALGVTSQFLLFGRDTVDAVDPESLPEPPFQAWKDFKKTKEYRTLLEPWMLYNLKRFHLGMPDREPTVAVYRGVLYAMLAHDHDETE